MLELNALTRKLLVGFATTLVKVQGQGQLTRVGFYSRTCPTAESIVKQTVQTHFNSNPSVAPGLLRMHFHDCFVQGCDASVLLDGPNTEKTAGPNLGLRGWEVIDDAKTKLEAACPGVVSCADILALAARDSVVLTKGFTWNVPTGRRDGRVSLATETTNLPGFRDSIDVQKAKFQDLGLNTQDLVTLFFRYRLYNFTTTGNGADETINPLFLDQLRSICPENGDAARRVDLDTGSASRFDATFFTNLKNGRGILESDQKLWTDATTKSFVQRFLGVRGLQALNFNLEFGKSMVKMSNIGVKSATNGEIRSICSAGCKQYPLVRSPPFPPSQYYFEMLIVGLVVQCQGQLTRIGFYSRTCPTAESIVKQTVQTHFNSNPSVAPGLLRMHFHDCFKTAGPNLGLRGSEVIDDAKTKLEAACPGVVSCADILALAARDSVVLTKGFTWNVPTGRRDGRVSLATETTNLPGFRDSIDVQKAKFQDLVGAHTIGTSACQFFRYRLYNFTTTGNGADETIDPLFLAQLRSICPENGDAARRVDLDTGSASRFDATFFTNLKNGRGILESDQKLWTDATTKSFVQRFLGVRGLQALNFNVEFGKSMVKMSNIGVKSATNGEIRRICSAVN
ncbi:unnamed protein product [Malus baccata var. baccata]